VPDVGVPKTGVTKVGLVAKTNAPEPVSSVTAAAKFAEDGVPKNVATPDPSDVMPVPPFATGRVPVTPVARLTFVTVLLAPLIVLFVKVSVLLAVMMLVGVMMLDRVAMITRSRFLQV
jgi:hypothetical protein